MEIRRIFIILLAIAMPVIAMADCYTTLRQKAIEAYNRGEYDRAKATFQSAKEDCPDTPSNNDIDSWIQKCNSAKKKQATVEQTPPKPVESIPVEEAPAPALLPEDCFFEVKAILIPTDVVGECLIMVQSYNNQILSMCDVYAEKLVDYTHNASSWSSAVADFRREEIIEMRSRIFMFREAAIAEVRKCNNEKSITTINGQVIDSKGEPIIAAQVIESGTSNGCLTDFDGKFTLKVKEDVILYISCKGYNGQNVNARKGMTVTLLKNGEKSNMANSAFHNNHEYVDLGLSVKWATCNVGATRPEYGGQYFAWGEISSKSSFGWNTYKHCKGTEKSITNYCTSSSYGKLDNKTQLHTFDDAAFANWGGNWRMPTFNEWIELKSKCKWKWCKQNGVKGYKITSNINGNSIFLPAIGHKGNAGLQLNGTHGYYWSSSLYSYSPHTASVMQFSQSDIRVTNYFRFCGLPIRPVCP